MLTEFAARIESRDYIPFQISGTEQDLLTLIMVIRSGLQARQDITIMISHGEKPWQTAKLTSAHGLLETATGLIAAAKKG